MPLHHNTIETDKHSTEVFDEHRVVVLECVAKLGDEICMHVDELVARVLLATREPVVIRVPDSLVSEWRKLVT